MEQHHEHSNEHNHHLTNVVRSEVNVSVSYENEKLSIQVTDVPEFEFCPQFV